MTRHLSIIGLMVCAGAASAQFSITNNTQPITPINIEEPRINEYNIDDGVGEDSVGLTGGGNIAFLNQFNVVAGQNVLTQIRIAWGQMTAGTVNMPVFVGAWAVTGSGATARPGALLGGGNFNAAGTTAAPPYSAFTAYNITDINLGATGTAFFIGVICNATVNGDFPVAEDMTAPNLALRSYAGFGAAALNQNDLGNVANTWGAIESFSPALAGNWLIRGDAVPTPGAVALFGLAGLAGARRRR